MYQCILNVPLWNNWSKVTYSQVHGSPVLKALLFQSFYWTSATRFAELLQFWQDPKCGRPRTFWRKHLVFHWRKTPFFVFTNTYTHTHTHTYIYVYYIYIYIYIIYIYIIYISIYIYIYIYINVLSEKMYYLKYTYY